ncbi:hypothetical protein M3Y97_00451700 [Aphelenchoides bicaudatus]|nr:hypothetical protein M3Y97_00451700 [Aphelenchoides bicaudatus]
MQLSLLVQSQLLIHFSTTISIGVFLYRQLQARFHMDFRVENVEEDAIHRLINYFYYENRPNTTFSMTKPEPILLFSKQFACGGGLVSTTAASLVSFPCSYEKLHTCCIKHDLCFDSRLGQKLCDDYFCNCLSSLENEGDYCDLFTHYGLCQSTRLFGHFFYEHGDVNHTVLEKLGADGYHLLDAYLASGF